MCVFRFEWFSVPGSQLLPYSPQSYDNLQLSGYFEDSSSNGTFSGRTDGWISLYNSGIGTINPYNT